jgi:PleD family two-component response regulator
MLPQQSVVQVGNSNMTKLRKLHPIVEVVRNTTSELNDLLNAVGLRIALLRHQLETSAAEGEMVRLAALVEKASQRVRRLEEYTRAEELVALMRPGRAKRSTQSSTANSTAFLSEETPRTALLITDPVVDDSAIRQCLEHSGYTVVVAESSAVGLSMLQESQNFDYIVCDSTFLAETGWKFTSELSRAAPDSRVYVLHRHASGPSKIDS